jgi:hypothetical protein
MAIILSIAFMKILLTNTKGKIEVFCRPLLEWMQTATSDRMRDLCDEGNQPG